MSIPSYTPPFIPPLPPPDPLPTDDPDDTNLFFKYKKLAGMYQDALKVIHIQGEALEEYSSALDTEKDIFTRATEGMMDRIRMYDRELENLRWWGRVTKGVVMAAAGGTVVAVVCSVGILVLRITK